MICKIIVRGLNIWVWKEAINEDLFLVNYAHL